MHQRRARRVPLEVMQLLKHHHRAPNVHPELIAVKQALHVMCVPLESMPLPLVQLSALCVRLELRLLSMSSRATIVRSDTIRMQGKLGAPLVQLEHMPLLLV